MVEDKLLHNAPFSFNIKELEKGLNPNCVPIEQMRFFLGGADLEMEEIRNLLNKHLPKDQIFDKKLSWGASLRDYEDEIHAAILEDDFYAIVIELSGDTKNICGDLEKVIVIDHHGDRAGMNKPTAIEQVFALLQRSESEWTRWLSLVAANDRGYVDALRDAGANTNELCQIRDADRRAQGVTTKQEKQAREDLKHIESHGHFFLLRTSLKTSSPLMDFLLPEYGGKEHNNILILMPGEAAFFGEGEIIFYLAEKFLDCWYGGSLPEKGFWGRAVLSNSEEQNIIKALK